MKKAAETMKSLLKVKPLDCYIFNEDFVEDFGFYYWDKTKFGINENRKNFSTCSFGIDLLIFSRFYNKTEREEMGSHKYLMGSDIIWVRSNNGHPLVASLIINKDFE